MAQQIVLELPQEEFILRNASADFSSSKSFDGRLLRATPVIVNFQRLFSNPNLDNEIFPGIKNKELVHAAAALYDQVLPDVTEDIIYSTLFETWSRTILLVQDAADALEDFKLRAFEKAASEMLGKISTREETLLGHGDTAGSVQKLDDKTMTNGDTPSASLGEGHPLGKQEEKPAVSDEESRFANVFSDIEQSDEEDEEEDERCMEGVDEFLKEARRRRVEKKRWIELLKVDDCSKEPASLIGIEHRLVGCATFEQSYQKPGHKVIHLTLIATRKRHRKMGVGRYLTRIIRDPAFAGKYDAVVVNADHNATEFFEKEGFSGNVLLNSKYFEIGDTWYNCKRMCYFPPYQSAFDSMSVTGQSVPNVYFSELQGLDLKQMELDLELYQEKSLQAFQSHALIVERLRKEVVLLRARVEAQHDEIQALKMENKTIREAKYACEKDFLNLKLRTLTHAAGNLIDYALDINGDDSEEDGEDNDAEDPVGACGGT